MAEGVVVVLRKSTDKCVGRFSAKIQTLLFLYWHTPGGKFRGRFRGYRTCPRNCSR